MILLMPNFNMMIFLLLMNNFFIMFLFINFNNYMKINYNIILKTLYLNFI